MVIIRKKRARATNPTMLGCATQRRGLGTNGRTRACTARPSLQDGISQQDQGVSGGREVSSATPVGRCEARGPGGVSGARGGPSARLAALLALPGPESRTRSGGECPAPRVIPPNAALIRHQRPPGSGPGAQTPGDLLRGYHDLVAIPEQRCGSMCTPSIRRSRSTACGLSRSWLTSRMPRSRRALVSSPSARPLIRTLSGAADTRRP